MKIKIKKPTGQKITYPAIGVLNGVYYFISKKYHPFEENEFYVAINMGNGEWFKWEYDPLTIFSDIEILPIGTKIKITL